MADNGRGRSEATQGSAVRRRPSLKRKPVQSPWQQRGSKQRAPRQQRLQRASRRFRRTPPGGIVVEAETDMAEESALHTHEGRGWS